MATVIMDCAVRRPSDIRKMSGDTKSDTANGIGNVLDLTLKELEKVLYFESWIVLDPKNTPLKKKDLLTDEEYNDLQEQYGRDAFEVSIGAEAVRALLEEVDLVKMDEELRAELRVSISETKRKKYIKRLKGRKHKEYNKVVCLSTDCRKLQKIDVGIWVSEINRKI